VGAAGRALGQQAAQVLLGVDDALANLGTGWQAVLRLGAFVAPQSAEALGGLLHKELLRRGAASVTLGWALQAPLGDGAGALALEVDVWVRGPGASTGAVLQRGPRATWLDLGSERRVLLAGVSASSLIADPRTQTLQAFSRAEQMLAEAGLSLANVVRTWLYVPHIVACTRGGAQHYQLVNEARAGWFERAGASAPLGELSAGAPASGGPQYPASTGIGVARGPLVLDLEAVAGPPGSVWAAPLENPLQQPASAYPGEVLAGGDAGARPLFSRALLEAGAAGRRLHVSGTAAIRGAHSLHPDDAAAQAALTLDNIEALLGRVPTVLADGTPAPALRDLSRLRVYVKRPPDLPGVAAAVQQRCGSEVPTLYVQADVCRDALLVEVEAVAPVEGP